MPGDVASFEQARQARDAAVHPLLAARTETASGYVRRAEEAMALLPGLSKTEDKATVCRISEMWLALAEAELSKQTPR